MRRRSSDVGYVLSFFVLLIAGGAVLLRLPASLGPNAAGGSLAWLDALFIATSAVCVTGLATVNIADFSRFGQTVVLSLIQLGGLGIISITSLLLILPGHRLSFQRLRTIQSFSVQGVEYNPLRIVRSILLLTAAIETIGAVLLRRFLPPGPGPWFTAFFHSISAFCNAGFSTFPASMEGLNERPGLLLTLSALIILGGIGFTVLQDIERRLRGRRKALSFHSRVVLGTTAALIGFGALAFWFLERDRAFSGLDPLARGVNALFQSVTPRTAGFSSVAQSSLSQPSKFLTILLMFIGGAPGSIAGGIKVSTAYIVLLVMLGRANDEGEINAFGRRLSPEAARKAIVYFLKAGFLLMAASVALSLTERGRGAEFGELVFESVSAFGTVGLSLGYTPSLSAAGKLVIIATMFAGRVGLIALTLPLGKWKNRHVVYPEAEVMVG